MTEQSHGDREGTRDLCVEGGRPHSSCRKAAWVCSLDWTLQPGGFGGSSVHIGLPLSVPNTG